MATIPTTITISELQLPFVEDAATEAGQTLEAFAGQVLSEGRSLQAIANDRQQQAWWRLQQAGTIPAEILAESRRHAKANAPKAAA